MDEKKQNNQIQIFEDQKIRTAWDAEQGAWYFSVVDVVGGSPTWPTRSSFCGSSSPSPPPR